MIIRAEAREVIFRDDDGDAIEIVTTGSDDRFLVITDLHDQKNPDLYAPGICCDTPARAREIAAKLIAWADANEVPVLATAKTEPPARPFASAADASRLVNSIGTCALCGYYGPGPEHDCADSTVRVEEPSR